jgi:flavin reductase (DIM6/NTAB) family NADH-FMN oxidoreductase RutF
MTTATSRTGCEDVTRSQTLRRTLARFATGVAIVTTTDPGGQPVGLTINSFTSLSLDPPLILWCLQLSARSVLSFARADYFAVNVLAAHQQSLARRFAGPASDRFAGTSWHRHHRGPRLVGGAIATFVCHRIQLLDGGDHVIVIGLIDEYQAHPGAPLLFLDGHYHPSPESLEAGFEVA